jgi:hypothetical protein
MSIDSHGYTLIAAYGAHLEAGEPYIQALCNRAKVRKAPLTAVCEKGGRWVTAEEITDTELRRVLGLSGAALPTVDPTTLDFLPVDAGCDRQVFAVALPAPHEAVIGQVVRYLDGSGLAGVTAWTAFPTGRATALPGRFAALGSAAKALAALVPADAVYHRNGWVRAAQITRPATRLAHGLPILTAAQFANADTLMIQDAAHLVLPDAEQAAELRDAALLPVPGQAVVADRGTVYWLEGNHTGATRLAEGCTGCASEAGQECQPMCTNPAALLSASVHDGRVDWTCIGTVELCLLDEENQGSVELAWHMLLDSTGAPRKTLLPGTVRMGEAELRMWEPGDVGNAASARYVMEVFGTNIAVERLEDGTTLVLVDADGADVPMCVEVDGHEVSA